MQRMKGTENALVFGHWHSLAIGAKLLVMNAPKCKWYLVTGVIFTAIYIIIPTSAMAPNTWNI